ncbi:sensor histidine kinase [Castellaniella defragrans]|uniref:histidine kinase n=1 Tax=Castellaniella defragrans TaxID=75697 RepID=A0A7W9TMG2_CASDE|nr:HAMP domain-containing sensor histidine kinase [Castellaniella defragrans]KAB0604050.1 HAMP domain-containing histidine kinase [Castellaniella defragrans]MBB6083349.1 signal transduction histidine kinase [Castellaniella defragrans]
MNQEAMIEETRGKDVGMLFLANFVHQVVNPLNGVIGTLHNITDGTYSGTVVAQKINASRAQLEQCVTLIRNLAYLSDFFFEVSEKEVLRPTREVVTSVLPQVVIEALQFFQISAERKGMEIQLLDSATQYRIKARPELIKQIFINLFDNWLKYGLPNQVVYVDVKKNKNHDLIIEIRGASVGFDNNNAEKLFEMGFRSKEAQEKVAQGSGIGLFICKEVAEKVLHGTISASHKHKGSMTTFRLAIPREKWEL